MPKVSDYELEHLDEEVLETVQKIKKKPKQIKNNKKSEKKDPRTNWRKQQEVKKSFDESEDSFDLEEY